jgi:translocator protein
MNKWLALAGFIILCLVVGGLASFATSQSVTDWYPALNKPSWTPPGWLFGPVWTTLYIMMGVAAWLVWQKPNSIRALVFWAVQLVLNFAWSFVFFGARAPGLGLINIIALWLAIAATIYVFTRSSRAAAFLLVPYLLWVSFATALNASIWVLNP